MENNAQYFTKRRVLTNGVEDTAWREELNSKNKCERKTVTRENGNSILRSNGYANLKDCEEHIQKLQGRVSRRKSLYRLLTRKNNTHVFLRARQVPVT